jgi:hypothetical protein
LCAACGAEFEQPIRGRPRKYCYRCVPPGSGAAAMRAWRAVNPERVEAYNDSRRVSEQVFYCAVCRRPFAATSSRRMLCGDTSCKYQREDPEKRKARWTRGNERRRQAKGGV